MQDESLQEVYVLHQRPFKNSSMLLELLAKDSGRISAIANGIKKSKSKGMLRPFAKVLVKISGKDELKTLANIENQYNLHDLSGTALYCGFYVNELSLKLLGKSEGGDKFFSMYESTINKLTGNRSHDINLRYFEYALLKEVGLGFDLEHDIDGNKIKADQFYLPVVASGLKHVVSETSQTISGKCIEAFYSNYDIRKSCAKGLRLLMYIMLNAALAGKSLKSRELLYDYLKLKNA